MLNERRVVFQMILIGLTIILIGCSPAIVGSMPKSDEVEPTAALEESASSVDDENTGEEITATEVVPQETSMPSPTSVPLSTSTPLPTPVPESWGWEVRGEGVGNKGGSEQYIRFRVELGRSPEGISKEAAIVELEEAEERLLEACQYPNRTDKKDWYFFIFGFGSFSDSCFEIAQEYGIPVYDGVPPEAFEELKEVQAETYPEEGRFWAIAPYEILTVWGYRGLGITPASALDLRNLECFESGLETLGLNGREYVLIETNVDERAAKVISKYGISVPHVFPDPPLFCSSGTAYEVGGPDWIDLVQEPGFYKVSYQYDEGLPFEMEVHVDLESSPLEWVSGWNRGEFRILNSFAGRPRGYDMHPWTLIFLPQKNRDQIYLTFNEEGRPVWLATDDWSQALGAAGLLVELHDDLEEPVLYGLPSDQLGYYRIREDDSYKVHKQWTQQWYK